MPLCCLERRRPVALPSSQMLTNRRPSKTARGAPHDPPDGDIQHRGRVGVGERVGHHIQHPASSIQHPASSIQHPVSSIQSPASSLQHPVSSIQSPPSWLTVRGVEPLATSSESAVSRVGGPVRPPGASISRFVPAVSPVRGIVSRLVPAVSAFVPAVRCFVPAVTSVGGIVSRLVPTVSAFVPAVRCLVPAVSRRPEVSNRLKINGLHRVPGQQAPGAWTSCPHQSPPPASSFNPPNFGILFPLLRLNPPPSAFCIRHSSSLPSASSPAWIGKITRMARKASSQPRSGSSSTATIGFDAFTEPRPPATTLPPKEHMPAFTAKVAPLDSPIAVNRTQFCTLATLRDTLLPKLLSGELIVAKLEPAQRKGAQ